MLPRTARKTDIGVLCLHSCLWMTAQMDNFVFMCGHSRNSNGDYYATSSLAPYHIHTTRCGHSTFAESGFSTARDMTELHSHHRQHQQRKGKLKLYPGCLAQAVIDMVYSVVVNQRQPQYTCNFLQRRLQPRRTWGVTEANISTHAAVKQVHLLCSEAPYLGSPVTRTTTWLPPKSSHEDLYSSFRNRL